MSGGDDVTVVWVAPEAAVAGAHSWSGEAHEDASRALSEWARARGLHVAPATDASSTSSLKVDLSIADRVEKELDRARESIAALDVDPAERALARAEAVLREHPELPQAAWLRAEVHRGWAARFTRVDPRDDPRAQAEWQEADALDGGRVPGIGEVAFPPRPRAAATLVVEGAAGRRVVARLDGVELAGTHGPGSATSYALDVPAAEHQVVVAVDGEAAFASWISLAPATGGAPALIPVQVGDGGSCSASALAGVTREGGVVRAPGVACEHWVAAYPSERRGAVLVARCDRSACGPFLEWRTEGSFGGLGGTGPADKRGGPWPAWATWAAVGVGAVAVTTVVLIATGVFESRPTEQRFVAGGVRTE